MIQGNSKVCVCVCVRAYAHFYHDSNLESELMWLATTCGATQAGASQPPLSHLGPCDNTVSDAAALGRGLRLRISIKLSYEANSYGLQPHDWRGAGGP